MKKINMDFLLKAATYIGSLIIIFIVTVLGTKYYFYDSDYAVKKTDLSVVSVDGIKLGMNINEVELSKYTETDTVIINCDYNFKELSLATNEDGIITCIVAKYSKVDLYVGQDENATKIKKVNEIWKILGSNYKNELYNSEVNNYWKLSRYVDTENDIYLGLIFSRYNNELSEIIVSNQRIKN